MLHKIEIVFLTYGCQLWNFESKEVHHFYVAWRKAVRKLWRLPYTTHCNLLHTINNSLPIEISLEKRSVKSIWSCVNSENDVVNYISVSNKIVTFWKLARTTDIFHISIPSCPNSGTNRITLFIIP